MSYVQSMPDAKNDVVIPEKIDGYTVTIIGLAAFHFSDIITSVVIPDTIIEIGDSAFAGCKNLKDITLSKNISKISNATFQNCFSLEKITIPANVKSIERHAFSYCNNLKEITLNEGLTSICSSANALASVSASPMPSSVKCRPDIILWRIFSSTAFVFPCLNKYRCRINSGIMLPWV